jgi:hypothetical protein
MYNKRLFEKDFESRVIIKVGYQAFMSITAELWQANLIALVSAFLVIKVRSAEEKYDHL